MGKYFLELQNIYKQYPGTLALKDLSCVFEQGKVHALLGKNGSGKSTLANIISGIVAPSSGTVLLNGESVQFSSSKEAREKAVSVVHQELSLIPSLSVAENIFLGKYKTKKNYFFIDWKETNIATDKILQRIGINIHSKTLVSELSIGQQQQVEIAKALTENPRLLILDEPTSALALKEVDVLFSIMKKLREDAVTMIYISHRLQELSQIADMVHVLRDGEFVGSEPIENVDGSKVLSMMFGKVSKLNRKQNYNSQKKKVVFSIENLTRKPFFSNISLSLHEGEVLGIAGLMGSGRSELMRCIYGLDSYDSGEIYVQGNKVQRVLPKSMKKRGMSYVPEDRKEEGLVQILSTHENMILASLKKIAKRNFFLSRKQEEPYVKKQIEQLAIRVSNAYFPVSSLSGGNQQKVVLGNWLNTEPSIMLFDEPSRGIDVESKHQIFEIIWDQKKRGVSSIMVSSELEELHEVCDRILVLRNGSFVEDLQSNDITANQLYQKCMTNA